MATPARASALLLVSLIGAPAFLAGRQGVELGRALQVVLGVDQRAAAQAEAADMAFAGQGVTLPDFTSTANSLV
jgi:hypothetical protein